MRGTERQPASQRVACNFFLKRGRSGIFSGFLLSGNGYEGDFQLESS